MTSFRLAWTVAALYVAGCATPRDNAVFVTKTALGIDVDSASATAAAGYNRVEGYLGPRYDTGTVPAVAGSFKTDGGLFDRKVRQVYATGNAALNATTGQPVFSTEQFAGERKAMFFGTGTVLGVNIGLGGAAPDAFTFGFKRKEVSVIPVANEISSTVTANGVATEVVHRFPSVFARFDNTTQAAGTAADSGLDVRQFFATGLAAERMANNDEIRREFVSEAVDQRALYRDEEHRQSRMVLNTLFCVSRLPDGDLPKVWGNAEALGVFKDRQVPAMLRTAGSAQAARSLYTGHIRLVEPAEPQKTVLLTLHNRFVCDLPGAKS